MAHWYDAESGGYVIDPDTGSGLINESGVPSAEVIQAISMDPRFPDPILRTMTAWASQVQQRQGGLFDRDKYVTPVRVFDQFQTAERAVETDDVVSNIADVTEALAFSKVSIECDDPDEEDVWNQIAKHIDLDARLREGWRDLFTFSNSYWGIYWGERDFKVRGSTDSGNQKRKTFNNMQVPLALTMLNPMKIVPIGNFLFNNEELVYLADPLEAAQFDLVLEGRKTDPIVSQLILTKYQIPDVNYYWQYFNDIGVARQRIGGFYLVNPQSVFRHHLTRQQYKQFAAVRMKSVFELLDLKNQLKEMDRATLIGATSFILLVKKGTDTHPANPAEIQKLSAQVRQTARIPVIVGDHRLSVEIVTPRTDNTLSREKYDMLNSQIAMRLFGMFVDSRGSRDNSMQLARVIARGLESRRHMMMRTLERQVIDRTMALNPELKSRPKLKFRPKRIALDFDMNLATWMLDLRDRGEISRDTMLGEFDFDEEDEARKRQVEKKRFDKVFETLSPIPVAPPSEQNVGVSRTGPSFPKAPKPAGGAGGVPAKKPKQDPKSAGRNQGGSRNGGGAARPSTNRGKSKVQQAQVEDDED